MQDTRLAMYLLEHGYQWLQNGARSGFWNAPFFYPASGAIVRSDSYIGLLPFYYAVRSFAADRESAYAIMFLLMHVLNFLSSGMVVKKLGAGYAGAGIAAFIFAFAMPVQAQAAHFQLLARFAVPPAFYFAWSYLKNRSERPLSMVATLVVYQWYCAIYTGFFLTLAIAAFLVFGKLTIFLGKRISDGDSEKRIRRIRSVKPLFGEMILALAIPAVALVPLLMPYYRLSKGAELISWEGLTNFLPRPASFLCPPAGSVAWGYIEKFCSGLPSPGEQILFSGLVPLMAIVAVVALAASSIKKNDDKLMFAVACAATVVALVALVLYVDGHSLYYYFSQVPGAKAVRAVSRITLVLLFPVAACAGMLADRTLRVVATAHGATKRLAPTLALVMALVVFADQYGTFSVDHSIALYTVRDRTASLTSRVSSVTENVEVKSFYYMPLDTDESPIFTHIDAMLASQDLNVPTINGYSGGYPWGYKYFYDQPRSLDPLKHWMTLPFKAKSEKALFDGLLIIKSVERSDYTMINSGEE